MKEKDLLSIVDETRKYLHQQKMLAGEELYLSDPQYSVNRLYSRFDHSLADYEKMIQNCQKCTLAKTRNRFVFGSGNPSASLMLIGEAPGEDEDLQGLPFVGKAGHLLDKILHAIDFKREEVFIGNILKCRPPKNRDPLPEEIVCCLPYLMHQIEIINPQILLILGRIAAQVLLKTTDSLLQMRGRLHKIGEWSVMVTYHPAALLRNPQWKRPLWEDIQKLRFLYDEKVGDKNNWHPARK
jgi:uracil-DNA glycosylase family 4